MFCFQTVFTKILLLSENHQRLTCLIGVPLETDMPHRRPTSPIEDRHAPPETDMPVETHQRPTGLQSPIRIQTHLFENTHFIHFLLILYMNKERTLIRHVGLRLVSDESPMGHKSGMQVSDGACRSLMKHVSKSPKGLQQ